MKADNDSSAPLRVPSWYWLLIPAALLLFQSCLATVGVARLSYSDFRQLLYAGKVSDVAVARQTISGTLKPAGLEQVLPKKTLDRIKCVQERPCRFSTVRVAGASLVQQVDLTAIAARTAGFAGADLANLINEAALLAGRLGKDQVGVDEIDEAIDRIVACEAAPGALIYPSAAPHSHEYSERTARAIDAEIARLFDEAHVRVREARRALLDALAHALLAQETVDRATLDALVKAHEAARPLPVAVKSGT